MYCVNMCETLNEKLCFLSCSILRVSRGHQDGGYKGLPLAVFTEPRRPHVYST